MRTGLRATLWLSLGVWVGALALFAIGVAPTVFSVVSPGEAGQIVGPILRGLNYYGVGAGLLLAVLAAYDARGRVLVALPIALALICGFSEFWVTSEIGSVRPNAFGADVTQAAARSFSFLHQLSRALYFCVMLGTTSLVVLHARFDASREPRKLS